MASKLLNTSKKNEKTGSLWTLNRFVHSADIATYTYVEGADASALTGIANSYILDYKQSKCGNHYYVQIVAVTDRWALTDTKQENKNGTIWEFNYRVAKADIATYTYDYGDSADALTSGTGTYVMKWDRIELPNYYLVKVTAVTSGYENDTSSGAFQTASKTYRSYDIAQFQFQPEWFGARLATDKDVTDNISQMAVASPCRLGDYIFNSATSSSSGLPVLTLNPFAISSITNDAVSQILRSCVPCTTYTVTFLTTSSVNNFESFCGVSGSFGVGDTSPATTGSGYWKTIGQNVQEDGKTIAGTTYNIVTRKFILAPKILGTTQLKWDPVKNGGTWSW